SRETRLCTSFLNLSNTFAKKVEFNRSMKVHPSVKILQAQGLGSRKICENFFWNSEIFCNGKRLDPEIDLLKWGDELKIDGQSYVLKERLYILMNKPAGYETSHKPSRHPSIFNLLPSYMLNRGVQAAGRLDVDTTGLLLLSDDGQFIHKVISGKRGEQHQIEKIYRLTADDVIPDLAVQRLLDGVELDDEEELICASRVERLGPREIRLGITTGKYHQVKRMIAATGNRVVQLHRERVGAYTLPQHLKEGLYMEVDPMLF
ncbi:16S rRNA pseudouridine(516) synthase, partial [Limnobacter litoralis]